MVKEPLTPLIGRERASLLLSFNRGLPAERRNKSYQSIGVMSHIGLIRQPSA